MATKHVRLLDEDLERIQRLSGLPEAVPTWVKVHALLLRLEQGGDVERVRLAVRAELARLTGGAN